MTTAERVELFSDEILSLNGRTGATSGKLSWTVNAPEGHPYTGGDPKKWEAGREERHSQRPNNVSFIPHLPGPDLLWTVNDPRGVIRNGIPGTAPLSEEQRAASLASIKDEPILLEKKGKH